MKEIKEETMSAIFAYAGNAPCKDIILEGLNRLRGEAFELSGITLKTENKIECLKIKGSTERLFNEAKDVGKNSCIGLGEASRIYRCKGSGITAAPAANKDFSVALDGAIENFESLKQWTKHPFSIATDEDLMLAVLTKLKSFAPLEIISKLSASLGGNPSYAFITSAEDAVYAKSGAFPLFAGVCDDGVCLSNELGAATAFAKKYYVIERGECCKITSEKITIYDSKIKKIKKQPRVTGFGEMSDGVFPITDRIHSLSFAVNDTVKRLVGANGLDFEYLRLGKRTISKFSRAVITGSGTSYRAARLGTYFFELMCNIPCTAVCSGELRYSGAVFDRETLLIAVSAGGENKDTIACVRKAKSCGATAVAITQQGNSLLSKECERAINIKLKRNSESVFTYVTELTALSLFTLWLGAKNEVVSEKYFDVAVKLAELLSGKVSGAAKANSLNPIPSNRIIKAERIFVTGLGADSELSLQAAEEINEIAPFKAFAMPCSELSLKGEAELKGSTVIAFITNRELMQKSLFYLRRLGALGAEIILYTTEGVENELYDFDNVISVTESLPIFDCICAIAALENTLSTALRLLESSAEAG